MGQRHATRAINAYGSLGQNRKTEIEAPDKTASGGLMAGAGMGAAGYSIGSSMAASGAAGASAGPWGAAIGAGIGLAAYLLS